MDNYMNELIDKRLLLNLTPTYMDIYCRLLAGETVEIILTSPVSSGTTARKRVLTNKYMEYQYAIGDNKFNGESLECCFYSKYYSLIKNVHAMQYHDLDIGLLIKDYFTQKKVG